MTAALGTYIDNRLRPGRSPLEIRRDQCLTVLTIARQEFRNACQARRRARLAGDEFSITLATIDAKYFAARAVAARQQVAKIRNLLSEQRQHDAIFRMAAE